ncbi:HWE histidine kinase domain-containing protein [Agrobacterium vitis]|uniref:HWE histidine kinase domain-containing protein n=1 Tax=Agrobacterium vitis TaxID=373 RepID=UPI0015DAB43D|nr:HWE histidine kinase domain-containing protein [Agrobacterium vitis]MCF1453549.1 hypothetical protein [Agrobacterium vitis]MCF1468341.1 hypothetical protein [Agrobacterium vitis]BCH54565.1 sensor histidine kinase [Agrobacterium vitis]
MNNTFLANSQVILAKTNLELDATDPQLIGNQAFIASILDGCGDCIKILDLQGRLQFMSEGGKRVMEVDNFSVLKGCPWPDFWSGEGNIAAKQAVETAIEGMPARFVGNANTAKGNEKFWDVQVIPIFGEDGKPSHLLSISKDITDITDAQKRNDLLNQELQHRIKNTLAMVTAMASQTLRGDDIGDRKAAFLKRIQALSKANELITTKTWQNAPMVAVVERALDPHLPDRTRCLISGPDINLTAKQALSLALSIHELATNATKYGALSQESGKIEISWSRDEMAPAAEVFKFVWRELGGPEVQVPTSKGFGSKLVMRAFAADFGGAVSIDYLPDGVVCSMVGPDIVQNS